MKSMLHHVILALGIIGVAGTASGPAEAQDGQPRARFKSSADVVTIQASVRSERGRPVRGLTATDFEVWDNGQLRQILSLRADQSSPLSLAILVDMSGSMAVGPKVAMARQAFGSVLSQLRAGQDEVAVFTFDSALHERRASTRDLAQAAAALDEFSPFGSTSLYDAVAATARRLAERSASHKAIIVLTDGTDTSSRLTGPEVSGLASSISVPVYVVATVQQVDQRAMTETAGRDPASDAADLRDLSDWTGGQLVFASNLAETESAASTLIAELRQQYVLAIEAASGREWRRLDVRVKRPSAVVRARSGYFGG